MESIKTIANQRVKDVCNEYYRRLTEYGVVHSSMWLRANLTDDDVQAFKAIQGAVASKHGY